MLFDGGLALCEFMLLSPPVAGKEVISSLKQTYSFFSSLCLKIEIVKLGFEN